MSITLISLFFTSLVFQLVLLIRIYVNHKKSGVKQQALLENAIAIEPISIVIAAKNEYENLKRLIPVLMEQSHPNFEVLVINDYSSDETIWLLAEYKAQYKNFDFSNITQDVSPINSKKYAIFLGIKKAKNEHILFTDADCMPESKDWALFYGKYFAASKAEFILGISPYFKEKGFLNEMIRYETFWTSLLYGNAILEGWPYMGVGRNMAYRKSDFLARKGFHGMEKLVGGDDDLLVNKYASKAKTALISNCESLVYSIPKTTWKAWIRQKKRHLRISKYYTFSSKLKLFFIYFMPILFWVTLILSLPFKEYHLLIFPSALAYLIIKMLILYALAKQRNESLKCWKIIIYEPFLVFFTSLIGVSTRITKRANW